MAFEEDPTEFYSDWGETVTITRQSGGTTRTPTGHWINPPAEAPLGFAGVQTSRPEFNCPASEIEGVVAEDTLTRSNGTAYRIVGDPEIDEQELHARMSLELLQP